MGEVTIEAKADGAGAEAVRAGPTPPALGGPLLRHSLVYAVVPFLRYGVSFAMTRWYTAWLQDARYGVKEVVDLWIILMQQLLGQNLLSGMMRIYFERHGERERALVVTSSTVILGAVAWATCGVALLFAGDLSTLLIGAESAEVGASEITRVLRIVLLLIPFQLTTLAGMYYLQMQQRSKLYSAIQLGKLSLEVGLHIWFMGFLRWGLGGFMASLLIGEATTSLLLTGWMLFRLRPRVSWSAFRPVLAYAAPLVPVGLFQLGLHQSDRRLIELVFSGGEGLSLVGVYGLGYKVAYVVNALMLGPFLQIWHPWIYAVRDERERARLVGRVSTYAVLAIAVTTIGVILFGRQMIAILSGDPSFLAAHEVIPWVASGYVFWALYNAAVIPLYIDKRTRPILWINFAALGANVALNLWWIPRLGIVGAAAATLASFVLLAALGMISSRRAAGVTFEHARLGRILAAVVVGAGAAIWIDAQGLSAASPLALAAKAAALGALLLALWRLVLFAPEREHLLAWVRGLIRGGRA